MAKDNSGVDLDVDPPNPFGSSPRGNMDDLFADLTNQDGTTGEGLEMSHADEALEALKSASNNESRDDSGDGMDQPNGEHGGVVGSSHRDEVAAGALGDDFLT
jgi:histone demethylase JARID1